MLSWLEGSAPARWGPMTLLTLATAWSTPAPPNLPPSLSRSSSASWVPVLAPDGTRA